MAENDWAIIIGINKYDFLHADDHLKYAVNDAVKMRQFLCEQAKFPEENVLLCCDSAPGSSPQKRPSRSELWNLLKNEIQGAKGAHNFWFFYAGHGIVHDHQDFLLPCDGIPSALRDTAIPISFVTDCLRDCGADNVVLVMDMCRNRTRSTDEGSRGIVEEMGVQTLEIAKERGIVTLFSCSRSQRSYEIGDLEQGAFTYALLEGLKQSTTPRALEQYLTKQLPDLNRQYGKPIQEPMVIPEPGFKYDRPLLLSCATSADIQQLAMEARDVELEEQDYEKAKALWWQVIEADRSTQSDRAKARKAIDRINSRIHQKTEAYEQRRAEEEQKKAAERQRELERQQELEQQQQEHFKQEAAAKQRQAEEQEKQQREAEELKRQQAEVERLRQEELEEERRELLKQEAAEKQRQVEEQERQRQEAEQLKEAQRQQVAQTGSQDELASEKGIDYTELRDLLAAGKWQEADQATDLVMCEVSGRRSQGMLQQWLDVEDIDQFPCEDLRTINQLWLHYSNGKFGFSVQKEIYESLGGTREHNGEVWEKFCDRVGWGKVEYSEWGTPQDISLTFNLELAPQGHLPCRLYCIYPEKWGVVRCNSGDGWNIKKGRLSFLVQRLVDCSR